MRSSILFCFVLTAILSFGLGCSKSKSGSGIVESVDTRNVSESIGDSDSDRRRPIDGDILNAEGRLATIYFDYDSSLIRGDQQTILDNSAKYLLSNPSQSVIVEGHCDDRGTIEYNFALGERRAESVRNYFLSRGADPRNLISISKGEEEPAVPGTGEASWSKNRRVEFKFAR